MRRVSRHLVLFAREPVLEAREKGLESRDAAGLFREFAAGWLRAAEDAGARLIVATPREDLPRWRRVFPAAEKIGWIRQRGATLGERLEDAARRGDPDHRDNPRALVELLGRVIRKTAETPPQPADLASKARGSRPVYDPAAQDMKDVSVYHRADLTIGSFVPGPAVIAEDETTTIVPKSFAARISPIGAILLEKVSP